MAVTVGVTVVVGVTVGVEVGETVGVGLTGVGVFVGVGVGVVGQSAGSDKVRTLPNTISSLLTLTYIGVSVVAPV